MKYLFISKRGDAAGIADRIQKEGNEVWMWIKSPSARDTLEGIVPKVGKVSEGLSKNPDVVIFDMVGMGDVAIRIKKLGYKVVGSGSEFKGKSFQDQIELDRKFGTQVMKTANILIPETQKFKASDMEKAKKFVKDSGGRYVMKPDGNKATYLSYVSSGPDDMINHMELTESKKILKGSDEFILQEFVEGIELSTEMWFSKGKPVFPANGTMEMKKFLDGDLGPNTGCMNSTTWFYNVKEPRIVQMTLRKLYMLMSTVEYTGPLDINCIVSKKDHKPYGLEWTARFGYNAIYGLMRLFTKDVGEHFYLMATGDLEEFYFKKEFAYVMRVTIPPFPLAIPDHDLADKIFKETAGIPIKYGGKREAYFPLDSKKSEWPGYLYETAGIDGEICELVGTGSTVEAAKDDVMAQFEKLNIPNKQARLDGWQRPLKEIPTLKSWGYEMPSVTSSPESQRKAA